MSHSQKDTVTLIDYGAGSLVSIQARLDSLEIPSQVSNDPDTIRKAQRIILPGVGHFKAAMNQLNESGLASAVKEAVSTHKASLLGICLGMQLLFESSEEGDCEGLRLLPGKITRLQVSAPLRVPHIGWNTVEQRGPSALWSQIPDGTRFYFVHSYALSTDSESTVIGITSYGNTLPIAVSKNGITGFQFHPEKSRQQGVRLLKNWYETTLNAS